MSAPDTHISGYHWAPRMSYTRLTVSQKVKANIFRAFLRDRVRRGLVTLDFGHLSGYRLDEIVGFPGPPSASSCVMWYCGHDVVWSSLKLSNNLMRLVLRIIATKKWTRENSPSLKEGGRVAPHL